MNGPDKPRYAFGSFFDQSGQTPCSAPKPPSLMALALVFALTEWLLADKRKLFGGIALCFASLGFQVLVRPYHYVYHFPDFGVIGGFPNWLMGLGLARGLLAFPFFGQRPRWTIGLLLLGLVWRELTALHLTFKLDASVFDPEDVVASILGTGLTYYFFRKNKK
jgi:hypothetical protein